MKTAKAQDGGLSTLQGLILPDTDLTNETEMYFRASRGAVEIGAQSVSFDDNATVDFGGWFNVFNPAKWAGATNVESLIIDLCGSGNFRMEVMHASVDGPATVVQTCEVAFASNESQDIRLDQTLPKTGLLWLRFHARGPGVLNRADWRADAPRLRNPRLKICVTTYRRELETAETIKRFHRYFDDDPIAEHLSLLVVDNGRSLPGHSGQGTQIVANPNLGGAGGFARGLIEARTAGCTYALFMDDDAALHMAGIARAWAFLAHAHDPSTAIAGSMIDAARPWFLWESGAVFNTRCYPLHLGTDLRRRADILRLEDETSQPAPKNLYGGWWFFAFPLEQARHLPFPFFVRGDDVSFGLANRFRIVTLPGVASFQVNFTDKESPLTWYLDLRSHLAHHLSLEHMEIGAFGCLRMIWWFYLRALLRMHYETAGAVSIAVADVLEGPEYFARCADLADRRAEFADITETERFAPVRDADVAQLAQINPNNRFARLLMKLSLNGHLLPGFSLFGNHLTLTANDRGNIRKIWGAARIAYLDQSEENAYVVRHSKREAAVTALRLARHSLLFVARYRRLRATWRASYPEMTSENFWRSALSLEKTDI